MWRRMRKQICVIALILAALGWFLAGNWRWPMQWQGWRHVVPSPASSKAGAEHGEPGESAEVANHEIGHWDYLDRPVRQAIDQRAAEAGKSWDRIVLHQSGSREGNLEVMDAWYRKQEAREAGVPFHFVIGNGTLSEDGGVFVTREFTEKEPTAGSGLRVCLIGDFAARPPTVSQQLALKELVAYLESKLGVLTVSPHVANERDKVTVPGRKFALER